MTQPDTDQQPQTTPAAPRRSRALRYTAIAAGILVFVAGIIWLVNATGAPAPTDYRVTAHGNISAGWISDDTNGNLDLANGDDTATVHARSLTITVQSTMPDGASCQIVDASGQVVDVQVTHPAEGVSGVEAWTTATCSTKK